jgi:hypothetical protein
VLTSAEEEERLGTELGMPQFCAFGKCAGGYARMHLGEPGSAVESILAGLAEMDAIKFYLNQGHNLCCLAKVQAATGAVDGALVTIEQALAAFPDQLCFQPFVLVQCRELHFRRTADGAARTELAEQDFREAIELARRMSAKSLDCARLSASPACSAIPAAATKIAGCSPKSTAGLQKDLIPQILKRLIRCSKNSVAAECAPREFTTRVSQPPSQIICKVTPGPCLFCCV